MLESYSCFRCLYDFKGLFLFLVIPGFCGREKISLGEKKKKEKGEKEGIVAKFLFLLDQSELAVFHYRSIFKFSQDSLKTLLDNI